VKATLSANGTQYLLELTPENDEEITVVSDLASQRSMTMIFRGYKYMDKGVEFLVQQPGRND